MDSGKRVGPILLKLKPPAKDDDQNGSSDEEREEEEDDEQDDFGCGSDIDGGFKKKKVVVIGADGRRGSAADVTPSLLQCQVDKCPADLTVAKTYYRRHKVCEGHSKAPVVVLAGLRQRFCQQCSRFHQLSEFDEARRSCRRRLAGHNERRRRKSSELGLKDIRIMRNAEVQ